MNDFTKKERGMVKNLIRKGILRRHAEWQAELRERLEKPITDGNEFDRSMEITNEARRFYKEAMKMEDFYRNTILIHGLAYLYNNDYLTDDDLSEVPEDTRNKIYAILNILLR